MSEPVLSVRDLSVDFIDDDGAVRALDRVSFDVFAGEILGLAGESGSGKSTLAQAVLRVLPPPAVIRSGHAFFEGSDLFDLDEAGLSAVRWKRISWVMQSALDALNPVLTVGEQLLDVLARGDGQPHENVHRAEKLLSMVGIPTSRLSAHPHQLSGGMRQRVAIAMALALTPSLLILDEPTTALDVVVERDLLREVLQLQEELDFAVIFIGHDIGRMLQIADRVAVLYAGRIAEVASSKNFHAASQHPYTRQLLASMPALDGDPLLLRSIGGAPASLRKPPPGCRFHPRCARAQPACAVDEPRLVTIGVAQLACHHPHDVG